MARVVTGDARRPMVSISGRTSGARRVHLTVGAKDERRLGLVAVQVDPRARTFSGRGRRSRTLTVVLRGRGHHRVQSRQLTVRVR